MSEQGTLFDQPALQLPRSVMQQITVMRPIKPSLHSTIHEQFLAFHHANPGIYTALVFLARELRKRGRTKTGIVMLYEVLRWQYQITTVDTDSDLKLNNNYRSHYARMIMDNCPDLKGMFELRELKA